MKKIEPKKSTKLCRDACDPSSLGYQVLAACERIASHFEPMRSDR